MRSLEALVTAPLTDRTDRRGSGALRFESLTVRNASAGGSLVRSGDDVQIILRYASSSATLNDVHVDMVIHVALDEELAQLSSTAQRGTFTQLAGRGELVCTVPPLLLAAGPCRITVFSRVNGEIADWVVHAAVMNVEPGDSFGTGRGNNEEPWQFPSLTGGRHGDDRQPAAQCRAQRVPTWGISFPS